MQWVGIIIDRWRLGVPQAAVIRDTNASVSADHFFDCQHGVLDTPRSILTKPIKSSFCEKSPKNLTSFTILDLTVDNTSFSNSVNVTVFWLPSRNCPARIRKEAEAFLHQLRSDLRLPVLKQRSALVSAETVEDDTEISIGSVFRTRD